MANPLKELELSVKGFQRIQEVAVNAPPAKVWASLIHIDSWFGFDPDRSKWAKNHLDLRPGGYWTSETSDGIKSLNAVVTHIEPNKLLRLSGPIGLTHLPVTNVFIFELQPKSDGKTTLLRVGQRTFGYVDADLESRYAGGWSQLLQNLKQVSEK